MNKNLTNNLTSPLIVKIVAAGAILILLVASVAILAIINISNIKDSNSAADAAQNRALAATGLFRDVLNERDFYRDLVANGKPSGDFDSYKSSFDSDIAVLEGEGKSVLQIYSLESQISDTVWNAMAATQTGNAAALSNNAAETEAAFTALLNIIGPLYQQEVDAAQTAHQKALDESDGAATFMLIWTIFVSVAVAGVGAFVVNKVLGPLRELNAHLSQLLWGQTEHLTDRLNLMQNEISNYNETLTAVRHDLKSPLSSIKGLAELSLILHPELDGDLNENLNNIIKVSDSSVGLISNLLARRETHLELAETDLNELVDKVVQLVDLRYFTVQRKVEVARAVVDPTLMEHALLNLISNARKFSAGGLGVGVQQMRKPGTVDVNEIEFWVWNDGAIINGEEKDEIFKPGVQTSEGKKVGGHGLGLAIVKNIAELHHGRVSVDSHYKKGTTFRITLPVRQAEQNEEKAAPVGTASLTALTEQEAAKLLASSQN